MAEELLVWVSGRSWMILLVLVGTSLPGNLAAHAQQFSADLAMTPRDGAVPIPAGRLRVRDNKVRLETPDLADGFFLVDAATPAAYFVRPGAGVFMDARNSSRLTGLFVPVDPENPCRQWQAMAKLTGIAEKGDWRCEQSGEQTIGSQSTLRYRAILPSGGELTGWIDTTRKFPVRVQIEDGSVISAENIRDQPQGRQQFELPAELRKFDPQVLIQRIKQSDVWVEQPSKTATPR